MLKVLYATAFTALEKAVNDVLNKYDKLTAQEVKNAIDPDHKAELTDKEKELRKSFNQEYAGGFSSKYKNENGTIKADKKIPGTNKTLLSVLFEDIDRDEISLEIQQIEISKISYEDAADKVKKELNLASSSNLEEDRKSFDSKNEKLPSFTKSSKMYLAVTTYLARTFPTAEFRGKNISQRHFLRILCSNNQELGQLLEAGERLNNFLKNQNIGDVLDEMRRWEDQYGHLSWKGYNGDTFSDKLSDIESSLKLGNKIEAETKAAILIKDFSIAAINDILSRDNVLQQLQLEYLGQRIVDQERIKEGILGFAKTLPNPDNEKFKNLCEEVQKYLDKNFDVIAQNERASFYNPDDKSRKLANNLDKPEISNEDVLNYQAATIKLSMSNGDKLANIFCAYCSEFDIPVGVHDNFLTTDLENNLKYYYQQQIDKGRADRSSSKGSRAISSSSENNNEQYSKLSQLLDGIDKLSEDKNLEGIKELIKSNKKLLKDKNFGDDVKRQVIEHLIQAAYKNGEEKSVAEEYLNITKDLAAVGFLSVDIENIFNAKGQNVSERESDDLGEESLFVNDLNIEKNEVIRNKAEGKIHEILLQMDRDFSPEKYGDVEDKRRLRDVVPVLKKLRNELSISEAKKVAMATTWKECGDKIDAAIATLGLISKDSDLKSYLDDFVKTIKIALTDDNSTIDDNDYGILPNGVYVRKIALGAAVFPVAVDASGKILGLLNRDILIEEFDVNKESHKKLGLPNKNIAFPYNPFHPAYVATRNILKCKNEMEFEEVESETLSVNFGDEEEEKKLFQTISLNDQSENKQQKKEEESKVSRFETMAIKGSQNLIKAANGAIKKYKEENPNSNVAKESFLNALDEKLKTSEISVEEKKLRQCFFDCYYNKGKSDKFLNDDRENTGTLKNQIIKVGLLNTGITPFQIVEAAIKNGDVKLNLDVPEQNVSNPQGIGLFNNLFSKQK